jgi:hypothetical protein
MAIQNKTFSIVTVISLLLASLALGAQSIGLALANPLPPPLIKLNSPQNNKIYSSNDIQLNFTVLPNTGIDFKEFSYSLDGQINQTTNENTILTDLSAGTHTLKMYGKGTYPIGNSIQEHNFLLTIVYFSVSYSTAWVIFALVVAVVFSMILLMLVLKRRQLVRALKGRKTASFWIGLVCFWFFAILVFIPNLWWMAGDYLFPHYPNSSFFIFFPYSSLILGLVFMLIGLCLMKFGTKKGLLAESK